jgi:AcrR family transcriptional regulator
MARLTREESKRRTRQLLLEAAKIEFAKSGYGGASADIIAENAGFSKGAFYAHFESKEDIFLELLKTHMDRETTTIGKLIQIASSTDQILKGIEAWFLAMQKDAEWKLLSVELLLQARRNDSFGKRFDELQDNHRRELGILIKSFFDHAKKKTPEKPERLAGALMALAHGLALVKTSKDDSDNMAGKLTVLILKGLLELGARA